GQCHTSRAQGYVPAAHHRRQEEPPEPHVHAAWRADKGYDYRGQRGRAWSGHHWRQGPVGQVRSDHKQPRKRRLHQRAASCLSGPRADRHHRFLGTFCGCGCDRQAKVRSHA
ncbi:hypothetical protein LPJ57_008772, partial [Coemansia sp. RSA 486]